MRGINISFEPVIYDDLEPENKSSQELAMIILCDVAGLESDIKKYNEPEINRCVRKLILKGYIKGTIIDRDKCIWSRLTKKGLYLLRLLKIKK